MQQPIARATLTGLGVTIVLAALIVAGSRNLAHFDAALVGYTFAVLFAAFGITYRYTIWLQRPPTAMYWRRGWAMFFRRRHRLRNAGEWFRRVGGDFALNGFIRRRDTRRWAAHMLLMWGCTLAFAITIPLVFGWLHFETVPEHLDTYRAYVFGFPAFTFVTESIPGFFLFHGLVWASVLVIGGVALAMRRRMRDGGAAALQRFGEDFMPLILLFAISITGLLLTASYTWMKGYGYDFLALLHAVTVIFTLLWLPFGKFFHIFQRPAQLGVAFYREVGEREGMARCMRCDAEFASRMHVEDLITVEARLGFDYALDDGRIGHYQRICPACRRRMTALAQGRMWGDGNAVITADGAPARDGTTDVPSTSRP